MRSAVSCVIGCPAIVDHRGITLGTFERVNVRCSCASRLRRNQPRRPV